MKLVDDYFGAMVSLSSRTKQPSTSKILNMPLFAPDFESSKLECSITEDEKPPTQIP